MKPPAIIWTCTLSIVLLGPVMTDAAEISLYPHPPSPVYQPGDRDLSCAALEAELTALEPLTYSYKPGFYRDPGHGAAILIGMVEPAALSYLLYSGVAEYYDQKRIIDARHRIAVLRQLKAYRHCYEQ